MIYQNQECHQLWFELELLFQRFLVLQIVMQFQLQQQMLVMPVINEWKFNEKFDSYLITKGDLMIFDELNKVLK